MAEFLKRRKSTGRKFKELPCWAGDGDLFHRLHCQPRRSLLGAACQKQEKGKVRPQSSKGDGPMRPLKKVPFYKRAFQMTEGNAMGKRSNGRGLLSNLRLG